MARSYPTIDQRRTNAAFASSRSSAPVGVKNLDQLKTGYVNAAKKLWQLSEDWEVNLAMNVFGPDLMGSFAFALDPFKKFEIGGNKVDVVRRRRTRDTQSYVAGVTGQSTFKVYRNYTVHHEIFTIVPEFLFDEGSEVTSAGLSADQTTYTTFFEDSTDSLRAKGADFNEMESCQNSKFDWNKPPDDPFTIHTISTRYDPDFPSAYERWEVTDTFQYIANSPVLPFVRGVGSEWALEGMHEDCKEFAADHLQDYLPQCLSNRRIFNAFYQIGELKDLPMMIEKTLETQRFLRDLIRDPLTALHSIDKALADAHLNYLFGYKSLQQVVKSLVTLPEKVAKRFNYLLRKNSVRASQRFTLKFDSDSNELGNLEPSWAVMLPNGLGYEVNFDSYESKPSLELRCVVNSTINFPEVAVPKFSDSNYRDLLGLNPRIIDVYNLIPWTWLGDWYSGTSKYLNLIESVVGDKDLINVGFVTILKKTNVSATGSIRIRDRTTVTDSSGNLISEVLGDPIDIPFRSATSFDYRTRFSIDDLFGVKSVSDKQGLLTDSQKAILGSLSTKFKVKTSIPHVKSSKK